MSFQLIITVNVNHTQLELFNHYSTQINNILISLPSKTMKIDFLNGKSSKVLPAQNLDTTNAFEITFVKDDSIYMYKFKDAELHFEDKIKKEVIVGVIFQLDYAIKVPVESPDFKNLLLQHPMLDGLFTQVFDKISTIYRNGVFNHKEAYHVKDYLARNRGVKFENSDGTDILITYCIALMAYFHYDRVEIGNLFLRYVIKGASPLLLAQNHSLYLNDILRRAGLNPNKVMLIRHSLKHTSFQTAYEHDVILEYTQMQKPNFYNDFDYVLTFVADEGTTAKFVGCYMVTGETQALNANLFSYDFPTELWERSKEKKNTFHGLTDTFLFKDMLHRLYIDWGKGTINWKQKATNEKPIFKLQSEQSAPFIGYENILLTFDMLESMIQDSVKYSDWHVALKAVYAIYLITDLKSGKQYVGAAYGQESLFGRWKSYVKTRHGNNKEMIALLKNHPKRYQDFQFSVLQIIPKSTLTDVNKLETLYKKKLGTRAFGLNRN